MPGSRGPVLLPGFASALPWDLLYDDFGPASVTNLATRQGAFSAHGRTRAGHLGMLLNQVCERHSDILVMMLME